MSYLSVPKKPLRKAMALLLSFTLVLSSLGSVAFADTWAPKTEQPVLVVTGQGIGLANERAYTKAELMNMSQATNLYSAINTTPTKSIFLGKGVKVRDLLGKSGLASEKYNTEKIAFVAGDGYKVTFDPAHTGDSTTSKKLITPALGVERYYFPGIAAGDASGKVPVETIIAFQRAGERGEPGTVPLPSNLEALSEEDAPLLMVGQQNVNEQNNPLYNKTIQKILVGEELPAVFKLGNREYTRSEIIMLPRVSGSWTYTKKVGTVTDYCVGVPLSELLKDYGDKDKVEFISADGYENEAVTVADVMDTAKQYVLVYETGTSAADLKAVSDTAKDNPAIAGYFRIYSQNGSVIKLVNEIRVTPAGGTDYSTSAFKHITNGGLKGDAPYGVDAITGATLTFEGPGLEASIPLSIREMENQNSGAFRGDYSDVRNGAEKTFKYEGIRLKYLLENMTSGTTGIKLTSSASKVVLKNRIRQTIAEFTLDQVNEAEAQGKPIIIAYGTSGLDGATPRPFVYDAGAGADSTLGNEDGCIKLVYDKSVFAADTNPNYKEFGNIAYIYVAESSTPGYKHDKTPYNTAENSQYIVTITGDKVGREVNYTVEQLEKMVQYENGKPAANGMGYRAEYSLSNSTYWYVNEYEGVKLWSLLKKSGIPDAYAKGDNSKTVVQFSATDGYKDFDKFTIGQIADPSKFGYYEKNPADLNDGKYVSDQKADLRSTGYPVLVSYGINGYPFVIKNSLEGYKSGLGNDAGPLRIISGKSDYAHANGSKQAKFLDKIIVGNEVNYSTHSGNPDASYKALANGKLAVTVIGMDGSTLKNQSYSVADIENLSYGASVSNTEKSKARVKGFYSVAKGDKSYSDLYEGIELSYFLKEKVQIPGTKGTVTFASGESKLTVSLDEIFNAAGRSALSFAKNGAPMVADKNAAGYVSSYTDGSGEKVNVKNDGGPLMVVMPQSKALSAVTSITVNLQPDKYAHIESPYKVLAENTLVVEGPGTKLGSPKTFKVSDIEGRQTLAVTGDYNIKKADSEQQVRYRGIDLYSFLRSSDIGLQSNASEVVLTAADGKTLTFPLADIMKTDYLNGATKAQELRMILAYGSSAVTNTNREDGKPLVASKESEGYDSSYGNSGGPLYLIVGQKAAQDTNSGSVLKNVVKITVKASATTSWKHAMSPVYSQYLDTAVLELSGTALEAPKKYTLRELEAMDEIILRDNYTYIGEHQQEGLDIWKLIQKSGLKSGAVLTSVKAIASDGFSKDILSIFGRDGLEKGIADGLERKIIMLSYAADGNPLVTDTKSDGYTSGNEGGPIRLITHLNQGACLKNVVKLVIDGSSYGAAAPVAAPAKVFTVYASGEKDGLPMAGVRAAVPDGKGGLWVGTYGGGAAYIAPDGKINTLELPGSYVNDIALDKEGGVWFTLGGQEPKNQMGVAYLYNGKVTQYTKENTGGKLLSNFVQTVETDSTGKVWLGTALGLVCFDVKAGSWQSWTKKDGLPAESVSVITLDDKGGVWIGAYPDTVDTEKNVYSGGYAYLDKDGKIKAYTDKENIKFADQWVRSIAIDPDGGAWIVRAGSYSTMPNAGGRVDRINPNGELVASYTGQELLPEKLTGNAEIRTLAVDYKGSLWIGTTTKGMFFCKEPQKVSKEFNRTNSGWGEASSLDSIFSIAVTTDALWAGSNGGVVHALSADIFQKSGAKSAGFTDIKGNWAEEHINYLFSKGLINGTGKDTFSPGSSVTRAEFVKLLVSTMGKVDLTGAKNMGFKDVADGQWYTPYINYAAEKGIIGGVDKGNFGPNEKITREQMAVMVLNFADAMNIKFEMINKAVDFKDGDKISGWAKKPISIVQRAGLINGKSDGGFYPKGTATRAEAAKMIRLLVDIMGK